jgi:hypothetical protein
VPGGRDKMLKPLILTPEKRAILKSKMLLTFLWIPDDARDERGIDIFLDYLFSGKTDRESVFYEIGNFDGIVGFYDIIPEYKCVFLARLWNRVLWTHSLVREIEDLVWQFKRDYKIKRISLATPDERLGKFVKMIGMKQEGSQKFGFRFEEKLYPTFLFRLV